MRKTSILALTMLLTAAMLAGCRSGSNEMDTTPGESVLPSTEMTEASTAPEPETTKATHPEPETTLTPDMTDPHGIDPSMPDTGEGLPDDNGDGFVDDTTGETGMDNDINGRIRSILPKKS